MEESNNFNEFNFPVPNSKARLLLFKIGNLIVNSDYEGNITRIASFIEQNNNPVITMNLLNLMLKHGIAYPKGTGMWHGKEYKIIKIDKNKFNTAVENNELYQRSVLYYADKMAKDGGTIDPFPFTKEIRRKLYEQINLKEVFFGSKVVPIKQKIK